MEQDSVGGASVVLSLSKPNGHNSRARSREVGLSRLVERYALIRLSEGRMTRRLCFPNVIQRS